MIKQVLCSGDITGRTVKNTKDEKLGKIEALMLDKFQGRIAYVVLSFGSFTDRNDTLVALPWSLFTYNNRKDCFVLDISKDTLKKSPGFDRHHWPDMADAAWRETIHTWFGLNPVHRDHH